MKLWEFWHFTVSGLCLDYSLAHSAQLHTVFSFPEKSTVVTHNIGFWRVLMSWYFCMPSVKQHILAFRCSFGLLCLEFVFCCHGIHSLWLNHCSDILYIFTECLVSRATSLELQSFASSLSLLAVKSARRSVHIIWCLLTWTDVPKAFLAFSFTWWSVWLFELCLSLVVFFVCLF